MHTRISKIRLIVLALCISCIFTFEYTIAQPNNDRKAQLESQKVTFISNKLKLTVSEAQKFWPVYNEYQQKREEILLKRREMLVKLRLKSSQFNDEELNKLSDEFIQSQIKESNLAAEYHAKFKEVLSIRKVVEFYMAEEQFKVWLLTEMKKKAAN